MIKSTTKSAAKSLAKTEVNLATKPVAAATNSNTKVIRKRISKLTTELAEDETPASNETIADTPITGPRTTKQNQVLTLLAQSGGVTINDVMRATGWQEHSVRGFFAGTVRKKLGFELTSEKAGDDDRRYAIKVAA